MDGYHTSPRHYAHEHVVRTVQGREKKANFIKFLKSGAVTLERLSILLVTKLSLPVDIIPMNTHSKFNEDLMRTFQVREWKQLWMLPQKDLSTSVN